MSPVTEMAVKELDESPTALERRSRFEVIDGEGAPGAPGTADQFDTRALRLEDEINPAILKTFAGWILQLSGDGELGASEAEIVRKGLPVALPEAIALKEEIREAVTRLAEVRKEAKPLLEGTKSQWSRSASALPIKPSHRTAVVEAAVDGAIAFLHAKGRLRVLRARFALLLEGALTAIRTEAEQRGHRNTHRLLESVRWLLNDL